MTTHFIGLILLGLIGLTLVVFEMRGRSPFNE